MRRAPGETAGRRGQPGDGRRSPRMPATASGARSNIVTSAGGSCDAVSIRVPVSILPPRSVKQRRQRVGDRLRPAGRHGPSVPMSCGENAQADSRRHRVVQRSKGVRRNTSEQGSSLRAAKPPGKGGRRQHGGRTEPGQRQRMMRHPQQRAHDVLGQRIEIGRRLAEQRPPPGAVGAHPVGRGVDRAVQHARAAAVERVNAVDLGQAPGQPVTIEAQPGQER